MVVRLPEHLKAHEVVTLAEVARMPSSIRGGRAIVWLMRRLMSRRAIAHPLAWYVAEEAIKSDPSLQHRPEVTIKVL
jgi:hypothetical protein